MSRIGKKPISIPQGVTVILNNSEITIKGPKGELKFGIQPYIKVKNDNGKIFVECDSEEKIHKAMFGTTRATINNLIEGVMKGFKKSLEIQGVGFRANLQGKKLVLSLGFSHPVEYIAIPDVKITIDEQQKNIIHIEGIDKRKVGQVAAEIRSIKEPEPYKGKGIRYVGENIIKKAGKSAGK